MTINDIKGVAFLVLVAFTFPVVLYVFMRYWEFMVDGTFRTRPDALHRKIGDSVCLAFPVITLLMFVQIGFPKFQKWWLDSPVFVSFLALLFFGVAPVLLGRGIVRVWRR